MVIDKTHSLPFRISETKKGLHIAYDITLNTRGITGKGKFFTVGILSIWVKRDPSNSPLEIVVRVVGHPHKDRHGGKIAHEITSLPKEDFFKIEKRAIEFRSGEKRVRVRLGDKQIFQIQTAIEKTIKISEEFNVGVVK